MLVVPFALSRRAISKTFLAMLLAGAAAFPARAAGKNGILLLAHGNHGAGGHGGGHGGHDHGDHAAQAPNPWNENVEAIVRELDPIVPTEVAFGMAEPESMQAAVLRLEARGVTNIAAVPLFVSSHSPIIGNSRYILGLQPNLAARTSLNSLHRVISKSSFRMSGALDADPLVSEILYARARAAMNGDPAKISVVIIAHGPNHEEDNRLWLADMEKHAAYLSSKGYRSVEVLTHRNDADPKTKGAAREAFRAKVEAAGRDGATVVVPLLMSAGGIEKEVEGDLKGLKFSFAQPLAPHPNLAKWVQKQYAALTAAP